MENRNEEFYSIKGVNFEYENKESCNKLLSAVLKGDEKLVKKLLKSDWSPNSSDNMGRTAVHLAARSSSHYGMLHILLEAGGFPDHVTHSGATPLCLAAYAGLERNVALLLDHGASVTMRNHIEATALHFACNGPSLEVVQLLVQAGASINVADFYKTTPLMLAVKNKNHNIVRFLLENGADVLVKDSRERTVFHYASSNDDLELFNILLKKYPKPSEVGDLSDSEGWTLLMFAAQWGSVRITDRLLELGSNTSKTNLQGLMALHLAAHNTSSCFRSLLSTTPIDKINALCRFSPEPLTNSLPCLLIDKFNLDGLNLLFNEPGIDAAVLTCPIVKRKRVFPPVPFSFFSESTSDFASSVIQMYVKKGLPLDPEFPSHSQTVTCLESLTTAHIFHTDPHHVTVCRCAELFVTLLEHGASPDPYSVPEDLHSNSVLWFVCFKGSTFGLSYLFRYSNFLEPHRVLSLVTNLILDPKLLALSDLTSTTIEFLCRYSRPWDVTEAKRLMTSSNLTSPYLEKVVASYHRRNVPFPSLKFLCRTVIREYHHDVLSAASKSPNSPLEYSHDIGKAFRHSLNSLPLPKSLLSYMQYDDIIFSIKTHPDYPSFKI